MTTDTRPAYRALDMLLNEHAPLLKRRSPYWAPRPPQCWRDVHTPAWSWDHPAYHDGLDLDLTYLDANAAYLSGASSAQFAHGELTRTGALPGEGTRPGYYLIDHHQWPDDRIVSPLGTAEQSGRIWIAYPTLELLQKLARDGYWPEVRVHDSWTCPDTARLRAWATAVNVDRVAALRAVQDAMVSGTDADLMEAEDWYENGVKLGYSQAVQMMLGPGQNGVKSKVRRPDWYHTIHAQTAANVWRYTWKCVLAGYVPVRMGSIDAVAWLTSDFQALHTAGLLKMDTTGYQLGHFKIKPRGED